MDDLLVLPCEFRKAVFMHDNLKGYWVTLYCLFVFNKGHFETHTFLHRSDLMDNYDLLLDLDLPVIQRSFEILVTDKNKFHDIYEQIEDYVSKSLSC